MKAATALGCILGAVLFSVAAPADSWPVAGVVFVDANGDGRFSAGEKGLAGAVVSDGVRVLKTDATGKFAFDATIDPILQEGELPIVSLSTPDGHTNTTDWFFRLNGKQKHDSVVLFGVKPQEQKRPFDFAHVTDMHFADGPLYQAFRQDMQDGANRFKFIINTGDMFSADSFGPKTGWALEARCKAVLENLPMPWWTTPGNHEFIGRWALAHGWQSTDRGLGYQLYWDLYGPLRWSFNYAGVHFVGVDIMERPADRDEFRGATQAAKAWLVQDLDAVLQDMPVYLFGHCFDGAKWFPVLEKRNVKGVFYGDGHEDRIDYHKKMPLVQSGQLNPTAHPEWMGYRIVRAGHDGSFSELFKFPGKAAGIHIVRRDVRIQPVPKPVMNLRGYVYGMAVTAKNLAIQYGGLEIEPVVDQPLPLKTFFAGQADLLKVAAGYHQVVIKASADANQASGELLILNTHGPNDPVPNIGPVKLGVAIIGVEVPAGIYVNGKQVAAIEKTNIGGDDYAKFEYIKTTQVFMFDLPPAVLKRLNLIEVRPGKKPDGRPDGVMLGFLWMETRDNAYRDLYLRGYGAGHGTPLTQYIDLQSPMPNRQRFFAHLNEQREP
jgi:hypothetical protein